MKYKNYTLIIAALISLLNVQRVWGCGFCEPTYNYYIFHVINGIGDTDSKNMERMAQAWSKLIHDRVTVEDIETLSEISEDKIDTLQHPVLDYARKSNDKEMMQYLRMLAKYHDLPKLFMEDWDYPSRQELQKRDRLYDELSKNLKDINSSRFKSQYQLLKMRLYFRMEEYEKCVEFWRNDIKQTDGTVYSDMTKGLYAGALFRLGKKMSAAEVYAEIGDAHSAMFCMNNNQNATYVKGLCEINPNSPVVPYMLNILMNNLQETHDYLECKKKVSLYRKSKNYDPKEEYNMIPMDVGYHLVREYDDEYNPVKIDTLREVDWFIYDNLFAVHDDELKVLSDLASEMRTRQDVKDKCMWMSVLAYIQYLNGKYGDAMTEIENACNASGTDSARKNARILRMLLSTSADKQKMDEVLGRDLEWLVSQTSYDNYESHALAKIATKGLMPAYEKLHNNPMALAARMITRYVFSDGSEYDEWEHIHKWGGETFYEFQKADINDKVALYNILTGKKDGVSATDMKIVRLARISEQDLADNIGTNYIRKGKWQNAIEWLNKVDLNFLSEQNIAPYVDVRDFDREAWQDKQKTKDYIYDFSKKLKTNKKLAYCRAVLAAKSDYKNAKGDSRYEKAYKLGSLYAQACLDANCWWLSRYKELEFYDYEEDCKLRGDFDFEKKASELFDIAQKSKDVTLQQKALFSKIALSHDMPYSYEWDSKSCKEVLRLNPDSPHYDDFVELKKLIKDSKETISGISHCDMLTRAMKL